MNKIINKIKDKNQNSEIVEMFSAISEKYDLLNNLMTFGMHKTWKEKSINLALKYLNNCPNNCNNVLDFCCGTGDLTILLKKLKPQANIICSDLSKNMLELANSKFTKNRFNGIKIICENAEEIDHGKGIFDLAMVGFGLRNVNNKEKCLDAIYDSLRAGGVFMCIDLGHPINPIWNKIYSLLFNSITPILGMVFAKNKAAYTYLPESLNTWYKQDELRQLLLNKGFKECNVTNFLGGVVSTHIAIK